MRFRIITGFRVLLLRFCFYFWYIHDHTLIGAVTLLPDGTNFDLDFHSLEILTQVVNFTSFQNFDMIFINSGDSKLNSGSENHTNRGNLALALQNEHFNYRELFSNFQIEYLVEGKNTGEILKRGKSEKNIYSELISSLLRNGNLCRTKNTIVWEVFTSWRAVEDFKNEVVNYYKLLHTQHDDCSTYFFMFLKLTRANNLGVNISKAEEGIKASDSIQRKLKSWAVNFNLASRVYLALISNSNDEDTSNYSLLSIYEFYMVKNISIVQRVCLMQDPFSKKDTCLTFLASKKKKQKYGLRTDDLPIKINVANMLQQKTIQRSNFHRAEIIAVQVDSPWNQASATIHYEKINATYRKPTFINGFSVREYWYVRDALNFTETAVIWPDYIKEGPHGTITGMGIPINSGQVDISIVINEYQMYRVTGPDALSFTHSTFSQKLTVCFKQPPISSSRKILRNSFTNNVWLALGGVWIIILTSLLISYECNKTNFNRRDRRVRNDSWLWVVSAICLRGWSFVPNSTPMRIVFAVGMFFGFIVSVSFSANLVSLLSIQVFAVNEFQDLINQGFDIVTDDHTVMAVTIVPKADKQGIIAKIKNGRSVALKDNLDNLFNTRMAIINFANFFYPTFELLGYNSSFICSRLSSIPYSERAVNNGWVVKKGSPIKKYINYKLSVMLESGVMFRLTAHYIKATSVRCTKEDKKFRQDLGLRDIPTALTVIISGIVISISFVGVENFYFMMVTSR